MRAIIWTQIKKSGVVIGLLSGVLAIPALASASSILFDFNSVSPSGNNGDVQTYMNGKLGATGSVVVTGANPTNSYTGDDHVVGPKTNPWGGAISLTLGNTDGGVQHGSPNDVFLITGGGDSRDILMSFFGFKIASVTFDYEIFPDASCQSSTSCDSAPDFTFKAGGTQYLETFGVQPGSPYPDSPNSCPAWWACGSERAFQLGPQTVTFNFGAGGVSSLDFLDWPATIGIDNVNISTTTTTTSTTPEPGTMLLLGTGLAGSYLRKRRKTAK